MHSDTCTKCYSGTQHAMSTGVTFDHDLPGATMLCHETYLAFDSTGAFDDIGAAQFTAVRN